MDGEAWWATAHEFEKSRTQLNYFIFTFRFKGKWVFPGSWVVKNLPANAGDTGSIPGLGTFHMLRSEMVTGRKARGPQVTGGNKLQVADAIFFSPSLLMKLVLPMTTSFFFFSFLFSNVGLIMDQQTSICVSCFMARDDSLVPSYLRNAYCGRGAWWNSLSLKVSILSDLQLANRTKCLAKN